MSSVVMVTGVSSGIGKAVAKQLLQNSYEVVGLSRRCAEELKESFADRFVQEYIDLSDIIIGRITMRKLHLVVKFGFHHTKRNNSYLNSIRRTFAPQ